MTVFIIYQIHYMHLSISDRALKKSGMIRILKWDLIVSANLGLKCALPLPLTNLKYPSTPQFVFIRMFPLYV
jgi:hypothetical protein